ncbi:MAG: tyrosine-type recombinase/integrase [Cytophagales bacterium]
MYTLLFYYQKLIEEGEILVQIGELAPDTHRQYVSKKNKINAYLESVRQTDITPDKITLFWVRDFELYLLGSLKRNSANKHLMHLGKALYLAVLNNDVSHNVMKDYKYKKAKPGAIKCLTLQEITLLEDAKLSGYLDKTRDLFLIQCYTGFSYSDLVQFEQQYIITNKDGVFIEFNRKKTHIESVRPMNTKILAILKKYNYRLPRYQIQNYNENIKVMLKKCGIAKELSSHAGRKTFAMISHNEYNVPISTVSRMIGHSSIATTQAYYVKPDYKKIAADMKQAGVLKKLE